MRKCAGRPFPRGGVTLAQGAKDFGVREMTLSKWLRRSAIEDRTRPGRARAGVAPRQRADFWEIFKCPIGTRFLKRSQLARSPSGQVRECATELGRIPTSNRYRTWQATTARFARCRGIPTGPCRPTRPPRRGPGWYRHHPERSERLARCGLRGLPLPTAIALAHHVNRSLTWLAGKRDTPGDQLPAGSVLNSVVIRTACDAADVTHAVLQRTAGISAPVLRRIFVGTYDPTLSEITGLATDHQQPPDALFRVTALTDLLGHESPAPYTRGPAPR